MAGGEQRRRNIVGPPGRDIGDDAAVIFVRADIVDRDLAFAEQVAQGGAGGFRQLAIPRDRPPSAPAHRCRAGEPASSASSPGDRCTRASNVSPSMVRITSTGCRTWGCRRASRPSRLPAPPGCRLPVRTSRPMQPLPHRQQRTRRHAEHEQPRQQGGGKPRRQGVRAIRVGPSPPISIYSLKWGHIPATRAESAHGQARVSSPAQKSEAMPLFSQSP